MQAELGRNATMPDGNTNVNPLIYIPLQETKILLLFLVLLISYFFAVLNCLYKL